MIEYKFEDDPNTACFTCKHVLDENAEILFVSHDEDDGAWQFLCGGEHTESDAKIVGIGQIINLHPEMNLLYEMPLGICAERVSSLSKWEFYKNA